MSDSDSTITTRLTGVRAMLLGIGAILTGGIFVIQKLLLQESGLPTQSPIAVALVYAGFGVVVLGFLYGVISNANSTSN